MTIYVQAAEFPTPIFTDSRHPDPGPRWGLLSIWAGFAIVAAGGLGASLALPNPATQLTKQPVAAAGSPIVERRASAHAALQERVIRLQKKLLAAPRDGDRWLLLAQTQGELRQYQAADTSYRQAAWFLTPDASLFAEWAEARLLARQQWDDSVLQLVDRALALDGQHVKALALAGREAFDRADYAAARAFWQRMKVAAPADSMAARMADANIAEAKRLQPTLP